MDTSFNSKFLVLSYLPRTACPLYRLINPYSKLSSMGVGTKILECDGDIKMRKSDFNEYKYIVLHTGFCSLELIKQLHSIGKIVIVDSDDYHILPEYHVLHKFYKTSNTDRISSVLRAADIITTTNEFLADKLKEYNKNVFVIPNFIHQSEYMYFPQVQEKDYSKLKIAYTGGTCHRQDIDVIKGLNRELMKNSINYELHLYGKGKNKEFDHYFNLLTYNGKYVDNLVYHDFVETKDYYSIFNDFNIVLAPLKIDTFNKCKSNLKYLEATYFKCILAASNISTYSKDINNGHNGILFSNIKELVSKLQLIEHRLKLVLPEIINLAEEQIEEEYNINQIMENFLKQLNTWRV